MKPEPIESRAENIQNPKTIEMLRTKHNIERTVYAGACAANGWLPGKALPEKEFLDGIAAFTRLPMAGVQKKESEER